uniref:Uncharacterized protein n=1 Tax=Biomphalaria glabrata TaxID=6526 RepID=A0A2C9KKX0_BIOGL
MRNATCYKGVICSEDCPPYKWDLNCVRSCNNCIDDCNKMNGSCSSCTKGFKFPEAGCIEACGKFQFGENCAGDCTKKCGEDCLERKTGTCPIHGNWGLWTEWTCAECPDNRLLRSRKCDNPAPNEGGYPCKGTGNETKLSTCYRNIIYCYDECPYKTWSLNCSKTCPHCADDCNKRTGACSGCLSGFKQPDLGCTKECEVGEYGTNCLGNCTMKCGEDCQDRITGRCPVYGTWMDWAEWHCTRNCSETRLIRYRRCKPNESQSLSMPVRCKGENVEMMKSTCYVTLTCPLDCPDFHWGIKCRACPHCKYDCDKFNASCRKCLPGFQSPETGCQRECDELFYGQDCLESCQTKCKSDCLDRVKGVCPANQDHLWSLLVLILPFLIFCSVCKSDRKLSYDKDSQEAEDTKFSTGHTDTSEL